MSSILEDWSAFCSGRKAFDKSHFLTLLHEEYGDQDTDRILEYFPDSGRLKEHMKRFQIARANRSENRMALSDVDACVLAMKDIREKSIALREYEEDELLDIVENVIPLVTRSSKEFEAAALSEWPNREWQILLGDYFDEKWKLVDEKVDALLEAFYGAANSYDMQWYLGEGLMNEPVNFGYYLQLWEAGFDTALTETNLLLFKRTTINK